MRRYVLPGSLFVLALSGGAASVAWPQAHELALRGPRFVAAWKPSEEAVDVSNTVVLRRRVSLDLTNVTADEALKEITRQADLEISYTNALLPSSKSVSLHAREITVAAALTEVLLDAGVDVAVARGGHMALVKRPALAAVPVIDSGVVSGRVTDKATGAPIAGATVIIEGTRHSATTGSDGQYSIADVPEGTYEVRARYIGYAPLMGSITVSADSEVAADFALAKSVQALDELVTVTPGGMQTAVKALPTPVTVITAEDIDAQRPQTINEVFRQAVPTGVGFAASNQPFFSNLSLRGGSSISGRSAAKVFIDGVEVSAREISPVDPASIARVEVLRGPQASTLFGPDAAGGVIQIFTRRGDSSATPQLGLRAQTGILQTPYDGARSAVRQQYNGSVSGGTEDVSYNLGGSWLRLNDWLPIDAPTRQSNTSVFAGLGYQHGILSVDLSARYLREDSPNEYSPEYVAPRLIRPQYTAQTNLNSTYGGRIALSPTRWWRHQLSVGHDEQKHSQVQTRPRLTTPSDTLLSFYEGPSRKTSLFYNTTVSGRVGTDLEGSLVAGFDHYRAEEAFTYTFGALNTTGTIVTAPEAPFTESRTTTSNTGWLTQGELSWREIVFLSAGLRADKNSGFGSGAGTAISPRVGLSTIWQWGTATIKLRGAYGRAIRAPGAGLAFGYGSPGLIVLANPDLRAERQRGWDGGVDVAFGSLGTLSLTGFSQVAENLITQNTVAATPVLTWQYQNLGRVRNRGVEVEGSLGLHPITLRAQYGYVDSRVQDLGPQAVPGSAVDVGDSPLGIPAHTAGGQLSVAVRSGTTVNAGATYVGSWRFYDFIAQERCFSGGECPTNFSRGFVIDYPEFVKVNAQVVQQLTPQLKAFVSVDNLTNNAVFEFLNATPRVGRISMLGLEARF